jgi:WD40 repeat protein
MQREALIMSHRRILCLVCLGLARLAVPCSQAQDADRLQRDSPGLVLDTGVRQGACDDLQFVQTKDDKDESLEILAAGDDKVVQVFGVGSNGLSQRADPDVALACVPRSARTDLRDDDLQRSIPRGGRRLRCDTGNGCDHEPKNGSARTNAHPSGIWRFGLAIGIHTDRGKTNHRHANRRNLALGHPTGHKTKITRLLEPPPTWLQGQSGLKIVSVGENSPAAAASLRSADTIVRVGGNRVKQLKELHAELEGKSQVEMELIRGEDGRFEKRTVNVVEGRIGATVNEVRLSSSFNCVRLIHFVDATTFLVVARDGAIREGRIDQPVVKFTEKGHFQLPNLFRVAISHDHRTLAAIGEELDGADLVSAELFDRQNGALVRKELPVQDYQPSALAFDSDGKRLAVGTARTVPRKKIAKDEWSMSKEIGGRIFVYDLIGDKWMDQIVCDAGGRVERVAFHPTNADILASAGGKNHEVRLWDLKNAAQPLISEAIGPGRCLWGVRFSLDGRHMAFQDEREGPWRVFNLKTRRFESNAEKLEWVEPSAVYKGWKVRFSKNPYIWEVIDPKGKSIPLDQRSDLFDAENMMPRCYTFLPPLDGHPWPRLAIGHMFGISIYELDPVNGPVLSRKLSGHDGDVVAIGASANGKMLLSASRDMTICAWSLVDWPAPAQRELGARIQPDARDRLAVTQLRSGSPAWEAGLRNGDQVVVVIMDDQIPVFYNPGKRDLKDKNGRYGFKIPDNAKEVVVEEIAERLRNPRPSREIILIWERDGVEMPPRKTTVRQRPLWRFFPMRNDEWLAWRWRDCFYDKSSPQTDEFAGWHVHSRSLKETPNFYELSHFPDRHRPEKMGGAFLDVKAAPEKLMTPDIEPAKIDMRIVAEPTPMSDLVLKLSVKPRFEPQNASDFQNLVAVDLHINEHLDKHFTKTDFVNGRLEFAALTISRKKLRRGTNVISLRAYNLGNSGIGDGTGFASGSINVEYDPGITAERSLYGVLVGIADYSALRTKIPEMYDLYHADKRAEDLNKILHAQKRDKFFSKVNVAPLLNDKASPDTVIAELRKLRGRVQPDDLLVVYFACHGAAEEKKKDSFRFYCHDGSTIMARDVRNEIKQLNCRQLILLDSCYSGAYKGEMASDSEPVGNLSTDIPRMIFSACRHDQEAIFDPNQGGIFTITLLNALADKSLESSDETIHADTLAMILERRVASRAAAIISVNAGGSLQAGFETATGHLSQSIARR